MIIRARVVVTMDGPPVENGAVVISGDRILDVGPVDEIKAHHTGEVIDLGKCALLPGLINAHCHLDYTCLRGRIAPQKTFTDWIRCINAEKAKLSEEHYLASINEGLAEAKCFGTTTIANLEAFPELIARIDTPVRIWWFAELIDVRQPNRAREIVDRAVDSVKEAKNWGLAPHAPFTASADLYRYAVEVAKREDVLLTTHLAESEEEMSMFRDAAGALCEFMKGIGRNVDDCRGTTPLAHFLATVRNSSHFRSKATAQQASSLRSARNDKEWIVGHLNGLSENDFDLLRDLMDRFHIVHCPRSHRYFGHAPFQFHELDSLGFNICLGTDSLASNEDLSLFAEMRAFQETFPRVSPEEVLAMVTRNPAKALVKLDDLGRLRPNCLADLVAVPLSGSPETVYEELIAFDGEAAWSMVGGEAAA